MSTARLQHGYGTTSAGVRQECAEVAHGRLGGAGVGMSSSIMA
ncbi:hypothetical protein AB0L47_11350 [Streptomyces bobili]